LWTDLLVFIEKCAYTRIFTLFIFLYEFYLIFSNEINECFRNVLHPSHNNCLFSIFFSQINCHFKIPMQHLFIFPLLYPYLLNFIQLNYSTNSIWLSSKLKLNIKYSLIQSLSPIIISSYPSHSISFLLKKNNRRHSHLIYRSSPSMGFSISC